MRGSIGVILLEAFTWVGILGAVSTIASSAWNNSVYTLALAAASVSVSLIRRVSARRWTFTAVVLELLTLFFVIAVVSNPGDRGMEAILATLAVWVLIEASRHLLRRQQTIFTGIGHLALLLPIGILLDGRSGDAPATPLILFLWAALEFAWVLVDQRFFRETRLPFSLTRPQKRFLVGAGIAVTAFLLASGIRNVTTLRYYDRTTTMETLLQEGRQASLHCLQEPWIVLGIDLSWAGFNPIRCFDSQEEVDEAMRQRSRA